MKLSILLFFFLSFVFGNVFGQIEPAKKYGELFRLVQENKIFSDQKKFVDCVAKTSPDSILKAFQEKRKSPDFVLKNFVGQYFDTVQNDTAAMLQHIHFLWTDLTRKSEKQKKYSSLLALPYPYIVPGGRFQEIYYWDSYFTMLGLREDGRIDMMENMVANFAYLIETYGHIPNGNRTYYLTRSQPPFFAAMVSLLADAKNDNTIYLKYLDALEKEYHFWMTGNKVVHLPDGGILNRYWDAENTPRPESYLEDVNLFRIAGRDSMLFRDLRSAAEAGWDFSTRWFRNVHSFATIHTTDFLPVDLNCLLYNLEATLAKAWKIKKDNKKAAYYTQLAEKRKALILKYCWSKQDGFFFDYDLSRKALSPHFTIVGMFPLFFKLADKDQAAQAKNTLEKKFLKPGGLVTTLVKGSNQQWDYPNGWPPMQWIGYKGLRNYGYDKLAREVARRWTNQNIKVYFETGKMMEKYDVVDLNRPGGGGEYKVQDGFGWTNGVFLKLWNELKSQH